MQTPKTVVTAFEHVRKYHPEVTHVFYNADGIWFFCDAEFEGPKFVPQIDTRILDDAADEVYNVTGFPAAFVYETA
jgi:hypothetical protein